MSDELISKKALIERLNDILFFSDKGADDPWRNGIRRARTVVEEAAPAELSALRAAQPLTPDFLRDLVAIVTARLDPGPDDLATVNTALQNFARALLEAL